MLLLHARFQCQSLGPSRLLLGLKMSKLPAAKKKVIAKVLAHARAILGGSGDPEEEDQLHISEYLEVHVNNPSAAGNFIADMGRLKARLKDLDPSWNQPAITTHVLEAGEEAKHMICEPWQFGFSTAAALKGRSAMSAIWDISAQFLESPFESASQPIEVLMPLSSAVGEPIREFGLIHRVGFGKTLAAKLVIISVLGANLSDQELGNISKEIQALYCFHCIYSPAATFAHEISKSLLSKMQAAERQRPTPVQVLHAFKSRVASESGDASKLSELISSYFDDFQDTLSEAKKFTANEKAVVQWLATISPGLLKKIEYHWTTYKVQESALPLGRLASLLDAASEAAASDGSYQGMFKASPDKEEAMVSRSIGIFAHKLKADVFS